MASAQPPAAAPDPDGAAALPRLTGARAELTREVAVVDADGQRRTIRIPLERALTIYVDRRELVTLMTLGQHPEWLVLGYLLNQRLVGSPADVESVAVDWEVGAAAVRTRAGAADLGERLARRVVTTGCGQGTVFGDLLAAAEALRLPAPADSAIATATILDALERVRALPSVHREAGSVHGTALLRASELLFHVEDVGRHNAVDTLAGWMAMHGVAGADKLIVTTGRLTSEMVLKAATCGVPTVVSRNGITAMGLALAQRLDMTLLGRASGRRFICYCGEARLRLPVPAPGASVAG
jgi:FdhD protein